MVPEIIEYLKTPPSREHLAHLIERMGVPARGIWRQKGALYEELHLDDSTLTEDALINAMIEHPVLMNRPIVVTPLGVRLCRPAEMVLKILPD